MLPENYYNHVETFKPSSEPGCLLASPKLRESEYKQANSSPLPERFPSEPMI
jgi:hypothetical protein